MAQGFKKDDKFIPTDRSAVPQLTVRELLPKEKSKEVEQIERSKNKEFAKKRVKEFGKVARVSGSLLRAGGERIKQHRIEKSAEQQETIQELDNRIDDILDESGASDSRKFRRLIAFASLNRSRFSKRQRTLLGNTIKELETRILKRQASQQGGMTEPRTVSDVLQTTAVTQDQFEKLPQELQIKIRQAV